MAVKLLEKPIYINVVITRKDMAEALEKAKELTGISQSTILVRHLIWTMAHPV